MTIRPNIFGGPAAVCDDCNLIHDPEYTHCVDCGSRMVDDPCDEIPTVGLVLLGEEASARTYYSWPNSITFMEGMGEANFFRRGVSEEEAKAKVEAFYKNYPNLKRWRFDLRD